MVCVLFPPPTESQFFQSGFVPPDVLCEAEFLVPVHDPITSQLDAPPDMDTVTVGMSVRPQMAMISYLISKLAPSRTTWPAALAVIPLPSLGSPIP